MDWILINNILNASLRVATPLILMGMGGLLCDRAGIFNIALEGFALIGAFFAIVCVHYSNGNVLIGMLGAMLAGVIFSSLFAIFVVKFESNHIITSIAMNMLASGLTTFLLRSIFNVQGSVRPQAINKLSSINIPFLEKIPVLGSISGQSIFTYLAVLTVGIVYIILFKTKVGLKIQAVGESEDASLSAGIKTDRVRTGVILASGALSAIAGAFLSTVVVSQFSEHMVQGRGFTAFTTVVFGLAHPVYVALSTLLFGFADSIGIRLELMATSISPSLVKMFPHILALVVLTISSYSLKLKKQGVRFRFKKSKKAVSHAQE